MFGIISGLICGFFGAGGGLLLVPYFGKILKLNAVESRATAITIIACLVVISSIFYYKNSNIDFKIALLCTFGGIWGSFIGSKLLMKLQPKFLNLIFTIFLYYSGVKLIFNI